MTPNALRNVNLRLPEPLLARVEALVPRAGAAPELAALTSTTRSDVLRVCLLRGLADLEAELREQQPQLPFERG